jgi:hypothetical protein
MLTYRRKTAGAGTTRPGEDATNWALLAGQGDVVGPASSTDNALVRFDSTTGKLVQNSGAILDDLGNIGLGVTPSAWSDFKAIQLQGGYFASSSTANATVGMNNYYDGTSYKYIVNGYASQYQQAADGAHLWRIAPSGTAGNAIAFTQAMTLDASGNLAVGTTSADGMRLRVSGYSPELYDPTTASAKFAFLPKGSQELFDISTGATLKSGYANLINISVSDSNGGDGVYYGAVAQSGGNAGANFVFGRRTGPAAWAESAVIDSSGNFIQSAPTSPPSLGRNGTLVLNLTSNTNLRVTARCPDGVTRTANFTLS